MHQVKLARAKAEQRHSKKVPPLTPGIHALATMAVNEFGVNACSNVPGIYPELGKRFVGELGDESDLDPKVVGNSIKTRAGALKRGGEWGCVVAVKIHRADVQSPLRVLEAAGKITITSPEARALAPAPTRLMGGGLQGSREVLTGGRAQPHGEIQWARPSDGLGGQDLTGAGDTAHAHTHAHTHAHAHAHPGRANGLYVVVVGGGECRPFLRGRSEQPSVPWLWLWLWF